MTRQEILDSAKARHDVLTLTNKNGESYTDSVYGLFGTLTNSQFDKYHSLVWLEMEKDLIDNGFDQTMEDLDADEVASRISSLKSDLGLS